MNKPMAPCQQSLELSSVCRSRNDGLIHCCAVPKWTRAQAIRPAESKAATGPDLVKTLTPVRRPIKLLGV